MPFVSVPDAIEEIRAGRILVVVDDEDRENEGDLTIAAEKVTPEIINFMAVQGRGLICLALTPERCDYLRLPLMSPTNTSMFGTAFCESIDARDGVTTGISAADRTRTILQVVDPACRAADLARPGHMFPLRAREGGVLVRAGQTEASVDLARLAGLTPAGVICEIMNDDGTMARVPQLVEFCKRHNLKMLSVADLIRHRMKHEKFVRRVAEGCIQTGIRRVPHHCVWQRFEPRVPSGAGARRGGGQGKCAGAHALAVRIRRCFRLERVRVLAPGAELAARDRRGGRRGCWCTCTRPGPGFRIQRDGAGAPRMLGHGRDFMHYKGEDGPAAVAARARDRRADSLRPGAAHDPPADQPSKEDRGTGRVSASRWWTRFRLGIRVGGTRRQASTARRTD